MDLEHFKKSKLVPVFAVLAISIIAVALFPRILAILGGKADDWQFSQELNLQSLFGLPLIAFLIAAFCAWIGISAYLIVSGKPIEEKRGGKKKTNPKRAIGIAILAFPFVATALFAGLAAASITLGNALPLLIVPFAAIAYIIWGIFFSIAKKAKIAIIPLVLSVLVFSAISFGTFFLLSGPLYTMSNNPLAGAGTSYGNYPLAATVGATMDFSKSSARELGFSAGGAKDVNNFRENIKGNYTPLPTDITYEGLFYDYYFETGKSSPCETLFCPSYSQAVSKDPFSGRDDYYLSVGLNSNLTEADFARKKLNLIIVLDISGSMGSSFSEYYYDSFGNRVSAFSESNVSRSKTKIRAASESIAALLDHLEPEDRLGIVLFESEAYLAKPLRLVGETDIEAIKGHILALQDQGGTNMYAGMALGTEALVETAESSNPEEYENRIIFLTDAMPNTGYTGERDFFALAKKNAEEKRIYTTFVGMGVDFNTELTEAITKVRGANYFSVHSPDEFKKRMADEFDLIVTPLVFNLTLSIDAPGFLIERVYGSPEASEATGQIMKVNTLFPSRTAEGETRGGIILLKLSKVSESPSGTITVSYEDRSGRFSFSQATVDLSQSNPENFPNSGIRKAVLLSRYADVVKNWIIDERTRNPENKTVIVTVGTGEGIAIPIAFELGEWERTSIPLFVSEGHKEVFLKFLSHFRFEASAIGDETLSKEEEILSRLAFFSG